MESNSIIYIIYKNGIDWQIVKEKINWPRQESLPAMPHGR